MFPCEIVKPTSFASEILFSQFDAYVSCELPKDQTEVWLIRHGESESNAAVNDKDRIRIAGRSVDSPLSEKGEEQAKKIGIDLTTKISFFTAYFTSPLVRASATATKIASMFQAQSSPTVHVGFIETNYGDLEGADGNTYDPCEVDMKKTLPQLSSFEARMNYRMVPNMESNREVYERVEKIILEVAKNHLGQRICVVTHNGPIKALFMHLAARDCDSDLMYHRFSVGNCAILCLISDGVQLKIKYLQNISLRSS